MSNRTDVRRVLDTVKAEGRTALTAPEGKIVCEAYGIAVPKEGVATSAADAATIAAGMGFPVVLKIVSPEILHKTEAGGVLVGVKSAEEARKGYDTIIANAKKYNAKANHARRPGAADARRRPGSDHRRGHRSGVRQAGRLRSGRRPGRSAQGHHVPSRAGDRRTTRCRCSTASPPRRSSRASAARIRSIATRSRR